MIHLNIPNLKGFILAHLIIVLFFAVFYYIIYITQTSAFEYKNAQHNYKQLSFFDFIYFSLITHATVGYGDIVPSNVLSKIITMAHIIIVIILYVIIIK
jgi:hypothetical protein